MTVPESWVLDGVALTSGAFTLMELTADPPRARTMWASGADSEHAVLVSQPLHENRVITMKLRVTAQASMDAALDQVAALVDKLRATSATYTGIGLVWTPTDSARSRTFDVLAGEIVGMPIATSGDGYSWILHRPVVTVELTCKPYWRGAEVLTATASSGTTPFATLEIPNVSGDIDALGRIIVLDSASQARRHVEWGLEGPATYNASTSLLVESDNLVTIGFAGTQTTATGAYDVGGGNTTVTCTLVPGQTTAVCGTGNLSHVGVFRVKARIQSGSLSNLFRLAWQASDGPTNRNDWVSPLSASGWSEIDLGMIQIRAAELGTQRWTGQIEVLGATTSPGVALVDYLVLVPAMEGYGVARAEYGYQPGVIVGYDQFTTTTAAAALNARVAPAGGTWATSGDATDFAFADLPVATDETVTRSATSGTAGRFGLLGTATPSDVEVKAAHYIDIVPIAAGTLDCGVVARYVDASNYLYATFRRTSGGTVNRTLEIRQVVAGVETVIASGQFPAALGSANAWWTVRLVAYASGTVIGHLFAASGQTIATATGSSSAVATAGALATGKSGIFDRSTSSGGVNRYYDEFFVSTPAAEPIAIYSGQTLEIRWDDTLREDSTGTYYGRPKSYQGTRVTIPVGTSRVLVKARRNDIEAAGVLDDQVADATTIQVAYQPRGLVVPR